MNDPFTKHNIDHLSASTINLYISEPAMCMLKLAGYPSIAGPSAWRGIAADKALTAYISKNVTSIESVKHIAEVEFDQRAREYADDFDVEKINKEKTHLMRCIDAASINFTDDCHKRKFESSQGKVEITFDDLAVPFIGYYDLLFDDVVFDLKTKSYALSKVPDSDSRQLSIYAKATGKEPWVAYITHKEVRQFRIEDVDRHLKSVEQAAKSLERVLSYSDDIIECCQLFYPNFDSWYWSNQDKLNAKNIWRMT